MATVALIGARGFLGQHIERTLLERGHQIAAFNDADYLIHAGIPYWPKTFRSQNFKAAWLAEFERQLAKPFRRAVFISVAGTLGPIKGHHLRFKAAAERLIWDSGTPSVIFNPTMLVGEGDARPSTGQFFRFFVRSPFAIMRNQPFNIVDVRDVARRVVAALDVEPRFIQGIIAGANTTVGALMAYIRNLAGKPMPRFSVPKWSAFAAAYASELVGITALPILGVELLAYGCGHFPCNTSSNPWEAVDRAFEWYQARGML